MTDRPARAARHDGEPSPALSLEGVSAGYDRLTVLHDVSISVARGQVVALLGPNGAGKTTLLRVAAGLLPARSGTVSFAGEDVDRLPPHRRAQRGLCLIPEGRGVFPNLTVRENIRVQTPPWVRSGDDVEKTLSVFPALKPHVDRRAGSLSGGQQQMLALARAWLAEPSVVLLDEVSMGLAPIVVDEIFARLRQLADSGTSLLIVEQYVKRALELAETVYVLDKGSIVHAGPSDSIDEATIADGYLSISTDPVDAESVSMEPTYAGKAPHPDTEREDGDHAHRRHDR